MGTKLVERFLMDEYNPQQLSTYALTMFRKNLDIDGKNVKVDIWDTAGQERFNKMHPAYYHKAHACILCFDVTRKATRGRRVGTRETRRRRDLASRRRRELSSRRRRDLCV